jgi:hypothetical protein
MAMNVDRQQTEMELRLKSWNNEVWQRRDNVVKLPVEGVSAPMRHGSPTMRKGSPPGTVWQSVSRDSTPVRLIAQRVLLLTKY